MNIFSDRHHSGLANSLHLLFEKRLGHNLYFPIGEEWANDYWKIAEPYGNNPDTIKQYLQIKPEYTPMDGTITLNHLTKETPTHYEIEDLHEHYIQKCITLDQFKKMDIDIIIASIPAHWKSFTKLRNELRPNAKVICQAGNHFIEIEQMIQNGTIKNFMAAIKPFSTPINTFFNHEEFSTNIFTPSYNVTKRSITCLINVLRLNGGFQGYYELKTLMPDWEFKSYGGQCDDGGIVGVDNIAHILQKTAFSYMVKSGADGYGFNLYTSFACGTPVIINYDEYKKELGGELLIPDETCIVANIGDNIQDVANKIQKIEPIKYQFMRQKTYEQFEKCVDFNEEAEKARQFVNNLL